jgi:hypothetical protein
MKYHIKYTLLLSLISTLAAPLALAANEKNTGQKATSAALDAETAARVDADTSLKAELEAIELKPGPQGPAGPGGALGPAGAQGATGAKGGAGAVGTTGGKGDTGATGAAGSVGAKGDTGAAGAQGATGAKGGAGAVGTTGGKGDTGATGAAGGVGTTGAAGSIGAKGDTGAAGSIGAKGDTGAAGADGVMYEGAFEGDMQYWNGNAWIMITAPAADASSLSFCDGQPTWTMGDCSVVDGDIYEIGDTGPAGGIVFYVSNEGLNGLEAAPADLGEAEWGCYGETVPGTFRLAVGTGKANTDFILDHNCGDARNENSTHAAAILTQNYSLGGYSDWFLPSIDDLLLMHENLHYNKLGGFTEEFYWSSSQITQYRALGMSFGSIAMDGTFNKFEDDLPVRAVRAF